MDVYECIKERRSVRNYLDKEVETEKLHRVLDCARLAPSANNKQNWRFVVVKDPELRNKLCEAAKGQKFVAQAPVVIVACALETDYVMTCGHPSHLVDLAIAIDHMTLAAREMGLGTCWVGAFHQDRVKQILNIPEDVAVVELLPVGYPVEWPAAKPRKNIEEIVCVDGWE